MRFLWQIEVFAIFCYKFLQSLASQKNSIEKFTCYVYRFFDKASEIFPRTSFSITFD